MSTRRIQQGLFDALAAPVEDWAAIICTSAAVRGVVEQELHAARDYIAQRFQAGRVPMPQLPLIPLGIHTERFAHDPAARRRLRAEYGIGDDDIAVMSMGRLNVFEKMHPVPLYIALQRAAEATGKKVHLLMSGWFAEDASESIFRQGAAAFAPDIGVTFPDGRDPALRHALWSAADIFALPVDNIQETFGLVPVEAMAAGLPVVCSEWNGFRDTIEDGVTGYRIRTLMAAGGSGQALANRFEDHADTYLQYLGAVQQRTVVDIAALADALSVLISSPEKRRRMGQAGRAHAAGRYDWAAIIPLYHELWSDLHARRRQGQPTTPRKPHGPANPTSIDPFRLYRGYPTQVLSGATMLTARAALSGSQLKALMEQTGAMDLRRMVAPGSSVLAVHGLIHQHGPIRFDALVAQSDLSVVRTEAIVLWLLKFDLVQMSGPEAAT